MTLSRVIVALGASNQTHINFRDSKLTRILQPSLSGNARMAVVCCATPSELYLEETRSTLQFASRAKLVKTRAQVNEVLDDQSIIRRLQRELALAKQHAGQGGGVPSEHVRALEDQAATAGTAAREAEERLKRLQASILNNTAFLAESTSEDQRPIKKRKRRLSEGTLLINEAATPAKERNLIVSPRTIPRPARQPRAERATGLSSSNELRLLKEALQVKAQLLASTEQKIANVLRLSKANESELVAAKCSNDILRSERDSSNEKSAKLCTELETLRAELSAQQMVLQEKDARIATALTKLEDELQDRVSLEETIDSLQEDNLALENKLATECASHQKTCEMAVMEQAQLQAQFDLAAEAFGAEKVAATNQIDAMNQAMAISANEQSELLCALARAGTERDHLHSQWEKASSNCCQLEETVSQNEQELSKAAMRETECIEQIQSLEESLATAIKERDETSTQLESMTQELTNTTNESAHLQEELVRKEEQVQTFQEENNELKSSLQHQSGLLKHVSDEMEETSKQNSSLQEELQKAENECDSLRYELSSVKESLYNAQRAIQESNLRTEHLELEISDAKSQLAADIEQKNVLERTIQDLQQEQQALESNVSELQSRLKYGDAAQQKLSEAVTHASQLEKQLEIVKNECFSREEELVKSSAIVVDQQNQIKESKAAIASLELKLDQAENANKALGEMNLRAESLEKELCENQKVLERVRKEADDSASMLSELQIEEKNSALVDLRKRVEAGEKTSEELKEAREQLESLNSELEESKMLLTVKDKEIELSTGRISELEQQEVAIRDEVKNLTVKLKVQVENNDATKLELTASTESGEAAKKALDEMSERATSLESQLETLKLDLQSAGEEGAKSSGLVEALQAQLEEKTQAIEEFKLEVDRKDRVLEQLNLDSQTGSLAKQELERVASKARTLEQDIIAATAKIEQLEKQNQEHEVTISNLKIEIQSADEAKRNLLSAVEKSNGLMLSLDAAREENKVLLDEKEKTATFIAGLQDNLSELNTLKQQNEESSAAIESIKCLLEAEEHRSTQIEQKLVETNLQVSSLQEELSKSRHSEEDLKSRTADLLERLNSQEQEMQAYETELHECQINLKSRGDELIQVHEMLEVTKSKESGLQKRVIDLEDELESKENLLSQSLQTYDRDSKNLRDEIASKEAKISSLESEILLLRQQIEHPEQPEEEKSSLEVENLELKKLLSSSNEIVEESRRAAIEAESLLQLKEHELALKDVEIGELNEQLTRGRSAGPDSSELLAQKLELENVIVDLKKTHERSLCDLKQLMGEEQRDIIRKAELNMAALREEVAELKKALEKSETEAYYARQSKEELEDKNKLAVRTATQYEQRIEFLEAEVRKASELERWISTVENERDELKKSLAEMDLITSELAAANLKVNELQGEKKSLEAKLESLENANAVQRSADSIQSENRLKKIKTLENQIENYEKAIRELRHDMEKKDERIKKLDATKLTAKKIEAMKKIKTENTNMKIQIAKLNKEIARKGNALSQDTSDAVHSKELAELRFHAEAIENKFRKCKAQCQKMEDERNVVIDVLRVAKIDGTAEHDLKKSIVNLCDKISSLEEERKDSVSDLPSSASSLHTEQVEDLQRTNGKLELDIMKARQEISILVSAAGERDEEITSLRRDLQTLRVEAEKSLDTTSTTDLEAEIRCLKQENLRLMQEMRKVKKQLQNARAEKHKIKLDEADDPTGELSDLKARLAARSMGTALPNSQKTVFPDNGVTKSASNEPTPSEKRKRNLPDKENSGNAVVGSATNAVGHESSAKKRRIPGLGESSGASDEHTQECNQS